MKLNLMIYWDLIFRSALIMALLAGPRIPYLIARCKITHNENSGFSFSHRMVKNHHRLAVFYSIWSCSVLWIITKRYSAYCTTESF